MTEPVDEGLETLFPAGDVDYLSALDFEQLLAGLDDEASHPSDEGKGEESLQFQRKRVGHNKAREERQAELVRLRRQVGDLEFTVKRLQIIRRQQRRDSCSKKIDSGGKASVWREACSRQLKQRLRVERENLHLTQNYKKTVQALKSIEKLLYVRPALWDRMLSEACIRTRRIQIPSECMTHMTALIFDELSAGVEATYRTVKTPEEPALNGPTSQPELHYNPHDGRIEAFDCTFVPFGMIETGEAWWRDWNTYRGHSVYENAGNVIKESFGLEMTDSKTNTAAVFYSQQILHRHVEDHRIVYVWDTYTEPFVFKSKRVSGVYYREQCYVLIQPADLASTLNRGGSCTRLSSCEAITTHFLDPKLKQDARIAALTKFLAKSLPPYMMARNETIGSLLLDEALQKRRCW
ncbi:hypothetical protein PRIC1_011297 [Phytophthora ramorum]